MLRLGLWFNFQMDNNLLIYLDLFETDNAGFLINRFYCMS
jgi:hypothetical protein